MPKDMPLPNVGGRPKKADHERRVKQVPPVRVTIAEYAHIKQKATALGMTLTDYARHSYLLDSAAVSPAPSGSSIDPETKLVFARLLRELNAIGVNLNQLTRDYNSGREGIHAVDWTTVHNELLTLLFDLGTEFNDLRNS